MCWPSYVASSAAERWGRVLTAALVCFCMQAHAGPAPVIEIHGSTYESGCADAQWPMVSESLAAAAADREPADLTRLVRLLLCGHTRHDARALQQHMPRRLSQRSEQTGIIGQFHGHIDRTDLLPLAGRAWSVWARAEHNGDVAVSFYPNEACAAVAVFRQTERAWLLVGLHEACD